VSEAAPFAKTWGVEEELEVMANRIGNNSPILLHCALCLRPLLVDQKGRSCFVENHCQALRSHGGRAFQKKADAGPKGGFAQAFPCYE
jgi:hypothetical protein